MNTNNNRGGNQHNNQNLADQNKEAGKSTDISLPNNDRPEGPFEHSGETARWTEEEKQEIEDENKEADQK